METETRETATTQIIDLLRAPREARVDAAGYVDVLPAGTTGGASLSQRLMEVGPFASIYERAWRPLLFTAWTGRTTQAETELLRSALRPAPGEVALDLACGPGNTTRRLAADVGDRGLAIGVDIAPSMLARAVADTPDRQVGFLRADATLLPLLDNTVDLATCLGALYLMDDPWGAIDEMLRVLRPGGRIAILTTCGRGPEPLRSIVRTTNALAGLRIFEPHTVLNYLRAHGVIRLEEHVSAASQLVAGELPRSSD